MKKIWVILFAVMMLAGCGKEKMMETVSDIQVAPTAAIMQQILIELPPELSVPAMHDEETGTLYLCDDYAVTMQTVEAGDLARTVQAATGMEKEKLQIIKTQRGDVLRYQWVWSTNGENGIQVGRGCILDDGAYHYVLTALAEEEKARQVQQVWKEMFASFRLNGVETVNIGS